MVTNPDELLRLAERVEQGSGTDFRLSCDLAKATSVYEVGDPLISLDAVEVIRATLLPGWMIEVKQYSDGYYADLFDPENFEPDTVGHKPVCGEAPTEARARLAALLRAVAAMEASHG